MRDQWDEDAYDTRCSEILSETIDRALNQAREMSEYFGQDILDEVTEDIADIEKTWRFLRSEDVCSDDIDYVLNETDDYYSDRRIDKIWYIDEPPKDIVTRWASTTGSQPAKRVRARVDPWSIISFYVEV